MALGGFGVEGLFRVGLIAFQNLLNTMEGWMELAGLEPSRSSG